MKSIINSFSLTEIKLNAAQKKAGAVPRLTYGRRQSETDYFLTLKIAWYLVMSIIAMPNWCTEKHNKLKSFLKEHALLYTLALSLTYL